MFYEVQTPAVSAITSSFSTIMITGIISSSTWFHPAEETIEQTTEQAIESLCSLIRQKSGAARRWTAKHEKAGQVST